jgi:hypothetical protein
MKEISLTKGRVAIVDDEDYGWISRWKWCATDRPYAARGVSYIDGDGSKKTFHILMHRLICGVPYGVEVDHVNRNTLDNRKSNLRPSSRTENNRNQGVRSDSASGYKGVYWHSGDQKWNVYISIGNKKKVFLGGYNNPSDAAVAYDIGAITYFGEFAYTNFPRENYAQAGIGGAL